MRLCTSVPTRPGRPAIGCTLCVADWIVFSVASRQTCSGATLRPDARTYNHGARHVYEKAGFTTRRIAHHMELVFRDQHGHVPVGHEPGHQTLHREGEKESGGSTRWMSASAGSAPP